MTVKIPNLPTKKVKYVIVDCNAPKSLFDYFDNNGIEYIKSTYIKNTIDAVSTHPDMQIVHVISNNFVVEPTAYPYYRKVLEKFDVNVIEGKKINLSTYPDDISYNVAVTDKFVLHNTNYTDDSAKELLLNADISIYNVKQGYTKCATCIIDNNAVITSDSGIHKVCIKNNIDCLLIENDNIKLGKGFDGFIGGCCGMIDYKKLLFCGDLSKHKSYDKIIDFASYYDVEVLMSSKEVLTDVGSIIPVIQE